MNAPEPVGEWLTRASIWLGLTAYVLAEWLHAGTPGLRRAAAARGLFTLGAWLIVAHTLAAFHFHYRWSESYALSETRRQTVDRVGLDWAGGLYVNYAFVAFWAGLAVWAWASPRSYPGRWRSAVRVVFFFMILNGAVIFVSGPVRWYGAALCLALVTAWFRPPLRSENPPSTT